MTWTLIKELTAAQMKARYRRTVAGFIWVILSPIIMYSAQALVFKYILKITLPNYAVFLLGGLLPWIFLVTSLEMGIPVLQSSRDLLLAFKVEPMTLIMCSLLDNWINFLAAFLIILTLSLFLAPINPVGMLMAPFALALLVIGAGSLLWLLAILNVFYRDTKFVVHFSIGVLFFLTPIFYPKELVPEGYRWLILLNPFYALIEPVRFCLYDFSPKAFLISFLKGAMVSGALFMASRSYWRKKRNEFYHYI